MADEAEPTGQSDGAFAGDLAEGGDPACWARRVCPDCGRLSDEERPVRCAACGTPFEET